MTTTGKGSEQSGGTSPLDFLRRRPVDHQFVEEDRKRIDNLCEEIRTLTGAIHDFAVQLDFAMREWRAYR